VLLQDEPVETRLMDRDEAVASGAMALFGEKYGDQVRVVSMGTFPDGVPDRTYSVELCGGTHANRTGEIGLIAIVNEAAVAAGVRRIEALTGAAARKHLSEQDKRLRAVAGALKVRPDEAAERALALIEERRKLERDLAEARKRLALGGGSGPQAEQAAEQMPEINGGGRFMARKVDGVAAKVLKGIADEMKKQIGTGVVAIVGVADDGKAGLVVGVTGDLTERFNAVDLVRKGAETLGGKGGGGRPDMAQAGGPDGSMADAALAAIGEALGARA
jgi:alanyl-tRNA synthetase